ncbi:MAG: NAD(P)-binding protein, partial [Pseudomonadota bacterium]
MIGASLTQDLSEAAEADDKATLTSANAPPALVGRIEGGYDAIVIGGGCDGVISACYLAKAGLKTALLERGSAAATLATREFAPGAKASDGPHLLDAFDPQIIRDLRLAKFGLKLGKQLAEPIVLRGEGREALRLARVKRGAGGQQDASGLGDAAAYATLLKSDAAFASSLKGAFARGPAVSLGLGLDGPFERLLEKLGGAEKTRLARAADAVAAEELSSVLRDAALVDALSFDAVKGASAGPLSPGSYLGWVRHLAGAAGEAPGAGRHIEGGLGGLGEALRRSAERFKVDIRTDVRVKQILVEWDAAAGVAIEGGGQLRAPIVVSALSAAHTLGDLVGSQGLDAELLSELESPAPALGAAKLHLALRSAPEFYGAERGDLSGRLILAPGAQEQEAAFAAARRGLPAQRPPMEVVLPSVHDRAMAKDQGFVLSALLYPAPTRLTTADRTELLKHAIATLSAASPGLVDKISAAELRLAA